jgi:rubredoxin
MSQPGSRQFQCYFCAHVYDEAQGDPASGIAPGTLWEDVPGDWFCPECGAGKADFALLETT